MAVVRTLKAIGFKAEVHQDGSVNLFYTAGMPVEFALDEVEVYRLQTLLKYVTEALSEIKRD